MLPTFPLIVRGRGQADRYSCSLNILCLVPPIISSVPYRAGCDIHSLLCPSPKKSSKNTKIMVDFIEKLKALGDLIGKHRDK